VRIEVRLPQWGMGQTEGTILEWTVKVGDRVDQGQAIAVVETAKVNGEVEAPVAGVMSEIVAAEGATLPTGAVLGFIDASD
jgi:pyruvate/2-oxoglutarate dehydrogenase complex dihydrolipoamide acyltransferase (E2) component